MGGRPCSLTELCPQNLGGSYGAVATYLPYFYKQETPLELVLVIDLSPRGVRHCELLPF